MKVHIFYQILAGLIFFCVCSLGYATPAANMDSSDPDGGMQADEDYQYDDASMPSSNTKLIEPIPTSGVVPYFSTSNKTIKAIVGTNVALDCPVQNLSDHNVVLWYKDTNVLTTGSSVLSKEYTLNSTNLMLKINNVTEAYQGEYFCEILPQKIRLHTTLIVSEDAIENIIPESSKSSQESVYFKVSTSLTASSVIGIFLFLRI